MAKKELAEIAVIGGSGLYAMQELRNVREIKVKTPFGSPSDAIIPVSYTHLTLPTIYSV